MLLNLLFGPGVWVGVWNGVAWVGWLVAALIWTMLALYLMVAFHLGETAQQLRAPLPFWLATGFDAVCVCVLIASGWHMTAAAYALSAAVEYWIYHPSSQRRSMAG